MLKHTCQPQAPCPSPLVCFNTSGITILALHGMFLLVVTMAKSRSSCRAGQMTSWGKMLAGANGQLGQIATWVKMQPGANCNLEQNIPCLRLIKGRVRTGSNGGRYKPGEDFAGLSSLQLQFQSSTSLLLAIRNSLIALPNCLEESQTTCRTHPSSVKVLRTLSAPGPRLPRTALTIRVNPTSRTPVSQRSTEAARVPLLHSLSSVGSPRSHTKGHGTAWSPPGGWANMLAEWIESYPHG